MSEEKRTPSRNEVEEKYKWAINDIYATDEAWADDLEKLKGYIEKIPTYKGRLSESADIMFEYGGYHKKKKTVKITKEDIQRFENKDKLAA